MARITGTTGADDLDGTEGADLILVYDPAAPGTDTPGNVADGLGGNDTILGSDERDRLLGRGGNDLLVGNDGDDALVGFEGNDTLLGGAGDDVMDGDEGADLLDGGAGDDLLFAQSGNDTLDGGEGEDSLFGFEGRDLLLGGAGDDTLEGNEGSDTLAGGAGNDVFDISVFFRGSRADAPDLILDFEGAGAPGGDLIDLFDIGAFRGALAAVPAIGAALAGAGNGVTDLFTVTGAQESFLVGDANDDGIFDGRDLLVRFQGSLAFSLDDFEGNGIGLGGTEEADTLSGTGRDERIFGFGGDDVLAGRAGDDTLEGGEGDDTLNGGTGFDSLVGGDGNDVLTLGASGYAEGGEGDDTLVAGPGGFNTLSGDAGFDTVSYARFTAAVAADLAANTDSNNGLLFDIEALIGSRFADGLRGDGVANALDGAAGDDSLAGAGGDDTLTGGAGADTLAGGAGADLLIGGLGDDLFVVTAADGPGRDTIRDFDARGDDVLSLAGFAVDDFAGVQAALSQQGRDVLLDLGDGAEVLFLRAKVADFTASDFAFA